MTYQNPDSLVSNDWLLRHIEAVEIRIIYVSWRSFNQSNIFFREFEKCHLPYAVYFNLRELFVSLSEAQTHLPSPKKFSDVSKELAIGNGTRIFIYDDGDGLGAGEYLWWLFRVFGHDDVGVVDGGLAKWLGDKLETSNRLRKQNRHNFTPVKNSALTCTVENIITGNYGYQKTNSGELLNQIIDCGSLNFPNIKMPNITNTSATLSTTPISSSKLLTSHLGSPLQEPQEIQNIYQNVGIDTEKPIVLGGASLFAASKHANALFTLGQRSVPILVEN